MASICMSAAVKCLPCWVATASAFNHRKGGHGPGRRRGSIRFKGRDIPA